MKNRIKEAREEAGLSQGDVAKYLGVTRQTVSAYERGQSLPRPDNWEKLAELLKRNVMYLQGYKLEQIEQKNDEDRAEYFAKLADDEETLREYIAATAADLIALGEGDALKRLAEFSSMVRDMVTNEQRVSRAANKEDFSEYDPFDELDSARDANAANPPIHLYFADPAQKQISKLIQESEGGKVPDNLKNRLQKILDKIESDHYRV